MASFAGAQAMVRVEPIDIFPNCPRYIPDPGTGQASPFIPVAGIPVVEPGWKANDAWKDVVPPRKA
ncbi:MAG: hypothetical protein SGJ21_17015 [Alphaproteobacteria bacterium]|nr:hypothetical protein [Alphaproteobacteria bacterium]